MRNRSKRGRDWRKDKTLVRRLAGDQDDDFRHSPEDDVLERQVDSGTILMWVPCLTREAYVRLRFADVASLGF